MGIFSGLSEKLSNIFSGLTGKGKLSSNDIKLAMREVRVALLEADVNLNVVKNFINTVSAKTEGEEVMKSLTPGQQVIKIVNEELTSLMGATVSKLEVASKPPTIIMLCGLQGSGKTTMCGKLALHLRKDGKKPLMVACDVYRPAAITQLKVIGKSINIDVFEKGTQNPVKTAQQALDECLANNYDTLIVDTAGRLHIDEVLMQELVNVKKAINPTEILLVVDAMTGQDAVNVATSFDKTLDISGIILTKLDGDTRGGAALSIKYVTGKNIKFCGTGEKLNDLELFYPDRMANRILGMGDVLTLIEKAQNAMEKEEMEKIEKRLRENSFTLNDFLYQFENIKKMGNIEDIISMIPGSNKLKNASFDIDDEQINKFKAIIQSMTPAERENPEIIKSSRRQRIAKGSGTTVQNVNKLLKQYEQTKDFVKQYNGKARKKFKHR